MYPATIFNWHDQSEINTTVTTSAAIDDAPLFMQVFSADKGSEDLVEISGNDFEAMYGTMNFARHGQSAIQAKNIIDAGGRLYAKRVVAEDSTLGNVILCANVTPGDGKDVLVKWTSHSIENCKTFAEVKKAALDLFEDGSVYPIFVYTDNGRGVSKKAIRLNPDYSTSKTIGSTFYTLGVYEGSVITEQTSITVDPTVVYANTAYRLDEFTTVQVSGTVLDEVFEAYIEKLAECLVMETSELRKYDVVYGYTNRGSSIEGFKIDEESVDLDSDNGIALAAGSNGAFGNAPAGTDAWAKAIAAVFKGEFSDEVWDVDQHKIAAVLDANYPMIVKDAIFDFVSFRKDCVFFRDYGVGLTTFLEISNYHESLALKRNYFTADYATSYMIQDPLTKKNIEVTMMYDLASVLVGHIAQNPYAPVAGIANGFVLNNAIKGTINFTPVNTIKSNYKEAMDDIRVNYAIFEGNNCVIQSCYTSQDAYTQLSYVNNVIAIQRVLRAVRTACPQNRYSLTTSTDLSTYATAVNNVLANFTTNFSTLNFVYNSDPLKASQKIFYASIEFAFLNWAQTEIFDIYAINNN